MLPTPQMVLAMTRLDCSRRSFLLAAAALAGPSPLIAGWLHAQSDGGGGPLMAYVGTFSSPLRDVLPTQVDLPPGNGRGIHLFQVNRQTGAMTAAGVQEMGTSPSCLALNAAGTRLYSANETDRVGDNKEGTVSAFAINRADGNLTLLSTVPSGGAGPTYVNVHPSGRFLLVANYFGGSVQCYRSCPTVAWAPPRISRTVPARLAPRGPRMLRGAALPPAGTIGLTPT